MHYNILIFELVIYELFMKQNHPQEGKYNMDHLFKPRQTSKRPYVVGFGILLLLIVIAGIVAAAVFVLFINEKGKSSVRNNVDFIGFVNIIGHV